MLKLVEKVESLQNLLLAVATGGTAPSAEYKILREELLGESSLRDILPRFVITCRDVAQFWPFIKGKFQTYRERREFIWSEFEAVLRAAEQGQSPVADVASAVLHDYSADGVHAYWRKALERKATDPEGAITLARTLLESVCKHVLDDLAKPYDPAADLPTLYGAVARELNLSPSQHTEQVFRQILSGCHSVVQGLGTLRNRLSDSHGAGRVAARPAARHAELAVNLAGSMAAFLVETANGRSERPRSVA